MKRILVCPFLGGVMLLVGCATTIDYDYAVGLVPKGKTQERVAVFDCIDLTNGDHRIHWASSRITNLSTVFGDTIANVLKETGYFDDVERRECQYQSGAREASIPRIGVVGEIREYKSGGYPHPTVFINPICAPALVGVPTAYCKSEGWCRVSIKFVDTATGGTVETLDLHTKFGLVDCWSSVWSGYADRDREGRLLLTNFAEELRVELARRLEGSLGRAIATVGANRLRPQMDHSQGQALFGAEGHEVAEGPASASGSAWAVIIGVSQYSDSRVAGLRYAVDDAQAFYDWVVSPEGGRYAPSRVKALLHQTATAENIKNALFDWLKQALEEDTVLIYFAGHGSPESPDSPDNLFLLPYDVKYDSISSTGFPMWDIETALKRYIKAKRVVVIADACHSGGVGQSFDIARRADRGLKVNPISTGIHSLSKVGEGVCVISASDENQYSQESKDWGGGHGVFTYFLLKGLKGDADYNKDSSVTLGELTLYLSQEVRRATRNAQSPTVAGRYDPALTIGK